MLQGTFPIAFGQHLLRQKDYPCETPLLRRLWKEDGEPGAGDFEPVINLPRLLAYNLAERPNQMATVRLIPTETSAGLLLFNNTTGFIVICEGDTWPEDPRDGERLMVRILPQSLQLLGMPITSVYRNTFHISVSLTDAGHEKSTSVALPSLPVGGLDNFNDRSIKRPISTSNEVSSASSLN